MRYKDLKLGLNPMDGQDIADVIETLNYFSRNKTCLRDIIDKQKQLNQMMLAVKSENENLKQKIRIISDKLSQAKSIDRQQELRVSCLKEDNNHLKAKIALLNKTYLVEKDVYEEFVSDVEVNNASISSQIQHVKSLKKEIRRQLNERRYVTDARDKRKELIIQNLTHALSLEMSVLCHQLTTRKDGKIAYDIYYSQTEQVQRTLYTLGWWQKNLGPEYRVGILFDTARIHNNRDLILIAERLMLNYMRALKDGEEKKGFDIPIRSILMANSLRSDKRCTEMNDITISKTLKVGYITRDIGFKIDECKNNAKVITLPITTNLSALYDKTIIEEENTKKLQDAHDEEVLKHMREENIRDTYLVSHKTEWNDPSGVIVPVIYE
jgi:hypothetical protein